MAATGSTDSAKYSAPIAFVVVAFSMMGTVFGGFMQFVYYAFASMVDPELPGRDRSALIAQRFLFGEGTGQRRS